MKLFKCILRLSVLMLFFKNAYSIMPNNSIKEDTISCNTSSNKLDGLYVGLEEMSTFINPSNPKWKWYHLSYLKINGNSVYLDQSPISIYKKDTTFSASGGGFYYYKGSLISRNTTIEINFKEISCDYCTQLVVKNADGTLTRIYRTKKYLGKLIENGIVINGYLFTKVNQEEFYH